MLARALIGQAEDREAGAALIRQPRRVFGGPVSRQSACAILVRELVVHLALGRISALPLALLVMALLIMTGCLGGCSSRDAVVLAVAASLRHAMPELLEAFVLREGGKQIVATYGGSGTLRAQVEAGAPIDGVVLAGGPPVDALIQGEYADADSRRVVATNTLVLIGPPGGTPLTFAMLERLPAGEKLAIGDPHSVPVGSYTREAFRKLGKWEPLQDRLVFGGHVAAVLAYVRRGEVAAAVVYRTDVLSLEDVVVLDEARGAWAPRAEVVAAATSEGAAGARVRAFLDFLVSAPGREILARHGFGSPA